MQNVDLLVNDICGTINAVLDKHTPYQKVKNVLKLKTKTWITAGIQNRLFNNYIYKKGIKNVISLTKSATSVPNTFSQNDESITDFVKIPNIFNNFFSTIAAKTKLWKIFQKNIFLTS